MVNEFWQNFLECITKKFFKFSGRASRKEYWGFILVMIVVGLIFDLLQLILFNTVLGGIFGLLMSLWGLFIIIPHFAVAIRRLHDTNKSGWYIVLPIAVIFLGSIISFMLGEKFILVGILLYIISLVYLIFLFVKKGDVGENRYGEDPYLDENLEI